MADTLRRSAPAKVNLYLHVGPVRGDGRHDLESLTVFAGSEAADRLRFEQADAFRLTVTGETAETAGHGADNLVARAVRALEAAGGVALAHAIMLEKTLPVAAGLGGGSADAGAVLRALGPAAGLDEDQLIALAATLGGDVPAAYLNRPVLMRGDGDRVTRIESLPPLPALLVNSGRLCPTGPVFRRYDEQGGGAGFGEIDPPAFRDAAALIEWLAAETRNDLEAPAVALIPAIAETLAVLRALDGVKLVRMSGSGASCFALFETLDAAKEAGRGLVRAQPSWWVRASLLGEGAC